MYLYTSNSKFSGEKNMINCSKEYHYMAVLDIQSYVIHVP